MNPKPNSTASAPTAADFKAVPWVRAIRDAMYEETRHMSAAEFAAYIASHASKVRAESTPGARHRSAEHNKPSA